MGRVAARAGLTTGAIYNHFRGKADLLVSTARQLLSQTRATQPILGQKRASIAAAAFVSPGFEETRRLLVELHLEATRSPELADLLAAWHREMASKQTPFAEASVEQAATIKVYFLLLMGLCHVDALKAVEVPDDALRSVVDRTVSYLFEKEVWEEAPGTATEDRD
jgi:AcrR family transcriptional regulator